MTIKRLAEKNVCITSVRKKISPSSQEHKGMFKKWQNNPEDKKREREKKTEIDLENVFCFIFAPRQVIQPLQGSLSSPIPGPTGLLTVPQMTSRSNSMPMKRRVATRRQGSRRLEKHLFGTTSFDDHAQLKHGKRKFVTFIPNSESPNTSQLNSQGRPQKLFS